MTPLNCKNNKVKSFVNLECIKWDSMNDEIYKLMFDIFLE